MEILFFFPLVYELFTVVFLWVVLDTASTDTLAGSMPALVTHIQYTRALTAMRIYTLIMFLLMNYKQTLRAYTYIPVTSG